jgi:ubiquitin C-terminal hydrolase
MNFEKYKNNGISGLANMGNTCFINSCMQIISHTYELNELLDSETFKNKIKNRHDSALLVEWDNLRQLLWKTKCTVTPGKFIKTIQKLAETKDLDIFTGYSQNDLPEFLIFVINCFHNSVSREIKMTISGEIENEIDDIAVKCFEMIKQTYSKEYSEIWNLFYAIHVSEIISLENGKRMSIKPEPFFMIDLPIPNNNKSPSIIDCFDLYVEGEILDGENAWYNEETKTKIDVKKKISFWSFPTILVIDFKRFNSKNQKKCYRI